MLDSRPPQQPTPAAAAILLIFIEYLIHWPQNCKIYQLFTRQQHSALLGCCQNQSRPEPGAELKHFFRFHKTRQFGQCPSVAVLLLLRVCWKWTSFFMLSRVSWAGLGWAGLGWSLAEWVQSKVTNDPPARHHRYHHPSPHTGRDQVRWSRCGNYNILQSQIAKI